jgi:hypothetical protein
VKTLGALLGGGEGVPNEAAEEIRAILLFHMVRITHEQFMLKSGGQKDRYGIKWRDLKPETKAYKKPSLREGLQLPGPKYRPTLSPEQDAAWRAVFKETLRWVDWGYIVDTGSGPRKATKEELNKSGSTAWEYSKAMGATTLLQLLGHKKVPLMIETGRLEKALRPGSRNGARYTPPNSDQVVVKRGFMYGVQINIPYAAPANARRRIVPKDMSKLIKDAWEAGKAEIEAVLLKYIGK